MNDKKLLVIVTLLVAIVLTTNVITVFVLNSLTSKISELSWQEAHITMTLPKEPQEVHVTVTLPEIVSTILQNQTFQFKNIKNSKLAYVTIDSCYLEGCSIISSKLSNSYLKGCTAIDTFFIDCQLEEVLVKNCTWIESKSR